MPLYMASLGHNELKSHRVYPMKYADSIVLFCLVLVTQTTLTSLALGDFNLNVGNFQAKFSEWWLRYLLQNCPQMNATGP